MGKLSSVNPPARNHVCTAVVNSPRSWASIAAVASHSGYPAANLTFSDTVS